MFTDTEKRVEIGRRDLTGEISKRAKVKPWPMHVPEHAINARD